MSFKFLRAGLFALVMAVVSDALIAQQSDRADTSRVRADSVKTPQQVIFPDFQTRLILVGGTVLVLGGLAFFLNAKRKHVDEEVGVRLPYRR